MLDPEAHLAEPVRFELLRSARPEEARLLVSFDADFEAIASVSALRLNRLNRPV